MGRHFNATPATTLNDVDTNRRQLCSSVMNEATGQQQQQQQSCVLRVIQTGPVRVTGIETIRAL